MNHAQARADHDNREEDVAVVGSDNSRRPVCGGSRLAMPRLGGSEEDGQNRRTHRARKLLEGTEQGVAIGFQLGVHLVEAAGHGIGECHGEADHEHEVEDTQLHCRG